MNDFDFIDYKEPVEGRNDYRTSSYLGCGRKMSDIHESIERPSLHAGNCKIYSEKSPLPHQYVSENRRNYTTKATDPGRVTNPIIPSKTTKYMKPFEEAKFLLPPTAITAKGSLYKEDFRSRPTDYVEPLPKISFSKPVTASELIVDRTRPGYAKYLDPAATTNRLAYTQHSHDGIAAKDNITLWTWAKQKKCDIWPRYDRPMCDKVSAKNCPRRRYEYRNMLKPVPYIGMTTEFRDNFQPIEHEDRKRLEDSLRFYPTVPFDKKTEASFYGSGEMVRKYVNIDSK